MFKTKYIRIVIKYYTNYNTQYKEVYDHNNKWLSYKDSNGLSIT